MKSNFISADSECWKCKKKIKVYTWPDKALFDDVLPPGEVPESLKLIYPGDMDGHGYWANTCSFCGVVQGDWFLYCEPVGVFFGVEDSDD